ncbi:Pr6Pr family membrane protein [Methylobacterium brachythecii]|uniref:Pr6Pr family membrane protein n=1 Tax=Methylobacterium brachythecii TaxID=1176177 RepID=A0A7W6AS75_9HYPH|nr:Pr6Pr family membrane protein [Methylobacterium brachythecii]MBB3904997.1 hypothetical protein [Methylobacterium brachythecii]
MTKTYESAATQGFAARFRLYLALGIACVAIAGLFANYIVAYERENSHLYAAWTMIYYFTNTTGTLVLIIFAGIALAPNTWLRSWLVAGASVAVLLVGVVQYSFRASGPPLYGFEFTQDFLLHGVLPVAVPIFWLSFITKGNLKFWHALIWAAYPLIYIIFILIHGATIGIYPYIFVDVSQQGTISVVKTAVSITAIFMTAGFLLVGFDRLLGKRRPIVLPF